MELDRYGIPVGFFKFNAEDIDIMVKITPPSPYKIMQLSREDIPLVTKGGTRSLVKKITKELNNCEATNCVLYVRYGPMFLQWLRVDQHFLNFPEVKALLLDEEMWIKN